MSAIQDKPSTGGGFGNARPFSSATAAAKDTRKSRQAESCWTRSGEGCPVKKLASAISLKYRSARFSEIVRELFFFARQSSMR